MPWFGDIPVCFHCGIPCPKCRTELAKDLPMELSTTHALLDVEEIHKKVDDDNEIYRASLKLKCFLGF